MLILTDSVAKLLGGFSKWFIKLSKEAIIFGCASIMTITISITVVYFKLEQYGGNVGFQDVKIQLDNIEKKLSKIDEEQDEINLMLVELLGDMDDFKTSVIKLIELESIKTSKNNVVISNIYNAVKDKITTQDIREILLNVLMDEALKGVPDTGQSSPPPTDTQKNYLDRTYSIEVIKKQ